MKVPLQTQLYQLTTRLMIVCGFSMVLLGNHVEAATVTMVNTNAFGESWATAGDWSNNQAANGANDYVVGTSFTVRPVRTGGSQTFPGISLTLNGTGTLALAQDANSTTTVTNLFVNGGVIVNAVADLTHTLAGGLTFGSLGGTIRTAGTSTAVRNLTIASTITGSGTVTAYQRGTISLTGSANSFSGTWSIGGNGNTATVFTTFDAQSSNALGSNSSVSLNAFASFDVDYDWSTGGSLTLNTDGIMILDQTLSVGGLTIGGTPLNNGTYTFDFLNGNYDDFFQDGGSGSITVIPEPNLVSLLTFGGIAALCRRGSRTTEANL